MSEVIEKDAVGPSNRTLLVIPPMPVCPTPDLSDLYGCAIFLELLDLSGSPRPALQGATARPHDDHRHRTGGRSLIRLNGAQREEGRSA
jgi:hypothetical protein